MDRTEQMVRTLFDFQRFARNRRLDRLIRAAQKTGDGVLLDDSELELNAAGDADAWRIETKGGDKP